jgi:hypothetical protein
MDAKSASPDNGADFLEAIFRSVIGFQGASRLEPGSQHREYDCVQESLIAWVKRTVDENVAVERRHQPLAPTTAMIASRICFLVKCVAFMGPRRIVDAVAGLAGDLIPAATGFRAILPRLTRRGGHFRVLRHDLNIVQQTVAGKPAKSRGERS